MKYRARITTSSARSSRKPRKSGSFNMLTLSVFACVVDVVCVVLVWNAVLGVFCVEEVIVLVVDDDCVVIMVVVLVLFPGVLVVVMVVTVSVS